MYICVWHSNPIDVLCVCSENSFPVHRRYSSGELHFEARYRIARNNFRRKIRKTGKKLGETVRGIVYRLRACRTGSNVSECHPRELEIANGTLKSPLCDTPTRQCMTAADDRRWQRQHGVVRDVQGAGNLPAGANVTDEDTDAAADDLWLAFVDNEGGGDGELAATDNMNRAEHVAMNDGMQDEHTPEQMAAIIVDERAVGDGVVDDGEDGDEDEAEEDEEEFDEEGGDEE